MIIYKRNNSGETSRYNSPGEIIGIDDSNFLATDPEIYDAMYKLIPENFIAMGDYFKQLSKLSADIITREILIANDLNNVLDADRGSTTVLNFLADRYNIIFPYDYGIEEQRLILKYYPNFIKIKGTESIINILNFIGRTEPEFYKSKLGNYEINELYEGYMQITIDDSNQNRINKFKNFAQNLINRLIPSGMYAEIIIPQQDDTNKLGETTSENFILG